MDVPQCAPSLESLSIPAISENIVASYIHGYLRILASGPSAAQRADVLRSAASQIVYDKLVLLCPSSGVLPSSAGLYSLLKVVGTTEPVTAHVAGARARSYGQHKVLEVYGVLVPVEPVRSLSTVRQVCQALEAGEAGTVLSLSLTQTIAAVTYQLKKALDRDLRLLRRFEVLKYDTEEQAAAVLRQRVERNHGLSLSRPIPQCNTLVLPHFTSVEAAVTAEERRRAHSGGLYMAWSFYVAYLKPTCQKRHVPTQLSQLCRHDAADVTAEPRQKSGAEPSPSPSPAELCIPVRKIVIVCPLELGDWFDDVKSLLPSLEPVCDDSGVTSSQERQYGAFTVYRLPGAPSEGWVLEVATPLRTLAAELSYRAEDYPKSGKGLLAAEYRRQAEAFVWELESLLKLHREVGEQYAVVVVNSSWSLGHALISLKVVGECSPAAAASTTS